MSKFNNASRTLDLPRSPLVMTPPALRPPAPERPPESVRAATPVRDSATAGLGFAMLCALLFSQYLNEWALRLVGTRAFVSTVTIVLVPLLFFMSGNATRGFRDRLGYWWLGFMVLLVLGAPFSVWRMGTLLELKDYFGRCWMMFFYAAALTTTLKRCRTLMMVNIACAIALLINCAVFGGVDEAGRFLIPNSPYVGNSNDLGLQLILCICFFLFLIFIGGVWRTVIGLGGILLSLMFMFRTGSRGCMVSAVVLFSIAFWVTKRKMQLVLLFAPIIVITLFLLPSSVFKRMSLIFGESQITTMAELSAVESKHQREELLKKSLILTVTHPIFGVGANQFPVAVNGEAEKKGERSNWLGTHNTYTEISSECGIPALICYVAVIGVSLRRSYAVYKAAAGRPQYREMEGLAFCLFSAVIVYAVATTFYHMAYTSMLPLITGQVLALSLAAKSSLPQERSLTVGVL